MSNITNGNLSGADQHTYLIKHNLKITFGTKFCICLNFSLFNVNRDLGVKPDQHSNRANLLPKQKLSGRRTNISLMSFCQVLHE